MRPHDYAVMRGIAILPQVGLEFRKAKKSIQFSGIGRKDARSGRDLQPAPPGQIGLN